MNQLYDTYFKQFVTVLGTGYRKEKGFIKGRYYHVQYADGTQMDCHESAFTGEIGGEG